MLSVILDIILIILKIIGIMLLAILGLVLILLLVVLFVPIRYKSSGDFAKNEEGVSYNISANVSWLLHIVSVRFSLHGKETDFKLKIFGINIGSKLMGDKDTAKKSEKVKKKKNDSGSVDTENVDVKVSLTKEMPTEVPQEPKQEAVKPTLLEEKDILKSDKAETVPTKEETQETSKEKKSISDKIREILNKISQICHKIKTVNDVKNSFIAYLKKDESKEAIREIKHIILKVLKHILPQKLKARIRFGFEDPSTTGNVLGVASVLYGVYGDNLKLEPDFERQVLEGEYCLKGRIRLFTFLLAAWKIFRNKWIRDFISFSKKSVQDL